MFSAPYLLVPIRVGAESPTYAVSVSVLSVTGSSGSLVSGMRVDALFFRKDRHGEPPLSNHLLLVLRNVEVDCGSTSATADAAKSKNVSLLLTEGHAQAVRALPASAVRLVVTSIPKGSRNLPDSAAVSAPARAVTRREKTNPVYIHAPLDSQASVDNQWAISLDSAKGLPSSMLRYLIWPTDGLVVFKTLAGTIRGTMRCRKTVITRKRSAVPWD